MSSPNNSKKKGGGILTRAGVLSAARVFTGGSVETVSEVNNMALYYSKSENALFTDYSGVVVSASSFGVNNSIVLSAKMKNNLSAGKRLDINNDYCCSEKLYALSNGEFKDGKATIQFGILDSGLYPNSLPASAITDYTLGIDQAANRISAPVVNAFL